MPRPGGNSFHVLALVVLVVAVAVAIFLPGEAAVVEDRRGDVDVTPDVVDARVPFRIAVGLGGVALAALFVWLGNRPPSAGGERREGAAAPPRRG